MKTLNVEQTQAVSGGMWFNMLAGYMGWDRETCINLGTLGTAVMMPVTIGVGMWAAGMKVRPLRIAAVGIPTGLAIGYPLSKWSYAAGESYTGESTPV